MTDDVTTPFTGAELDELDRLDEAAAPGPWEAKWSFVENCGPGHWFIKYSGYHPSEADAALVVAARSALPRLVAEVRRLNREVGFSRQDERTIEWHKAQCSVVANERDALRTENERLRAENEELREAEVSLLTGDYRAPDVLSMRDKVRDDLRAKNEELQTEVRRLSDIIGNDVTRVIDGLLTAAEELRTKYYREISNSTENSQWGKRLEVENEKLRVRVAELEDEVEAFDCQWKDAIAAVDELIRAAQDPDKTPADQVGEYYKKQRALWDAALGKGGGT